MLYLKALVPIHAEATNRRGGHVALGTLKLPNAAARCSRRAGNVPVDNDDRSAAWLSEPCDGR